MPAPAPKPAPAPVAEARQGEFNLDMTFGSAGDESPSDSMERVVDIFGDDDDLERMMASHAQNPSRPARALNVFPKKAEAAAEEALSARVRSMFDDEAEDDEFKPQPPPSRPGARRSSLGYNDMSDIFPGS